MQTRIFVHSNKMHAYNLNAFIGEIYFKKPFIIIYAFSEISNYI